MRGHFVHLCNIMSCHSFVFICLTVSSVHLFLCQSSCCGINVAEPAGQDLFALPAAFWAALPEPETAVCPATHYQPRTWPQRESHRNPGIPQQGYSVLCYCFRMQICSTVVLKCFVYLCIYYYVWFVYYIIKDSSPLGSSSKCVASTQENSVVVFWKKLDVCFPTDRLVDMLLQMGSSCVICTWKIDFHVLFAIKSKHCSSLLKPEASVLYVTVYVLTTNTSLLPSCGCLGLQRWPDIKQFHRQQENQHCNWERPRWVQNRP